MQYLAIGCRIAVAVVFLLAVTGKVVGAGAFAEFSRSVRDMRAAPPRLVGLTARATVLFETLVLVLVVIPRQTAAIIGFALAIGLTAAFSGAVLRTIRSGNRTSCRCFGRSSSPLGRRHLVRNAVLLVVAAAGLASSLAGGSATLAGALVAMVTGVFAGLLVAMFDDLAQLLVPATPVGRASR